MSFRMTHFAVKGFKNPPSPSGLHEKKHPGETLPETGKLRLLTALNKPPKTQPCSLSSERPTDSTAAAWLVVLVSRAAGAPSWMTHMRGHPVPASALALPGPTLRVGLQPGQPSSLRDAASCISPALGTTSLLSQCTDFNINESRQYVVSLSLSLFFLRFI